MRRVTRVGLRVGLYAESCRVCTRLGAPYNYCYSLIETHLHNLYSLVPNAASES